jgi:hypothetical protein
MFHLKIHKKSNLVCRNGVSKVLGAPTRGDLSSVSPPEGVAASIAASTDGGAVRGRVVPVMEGP